RLCRDPGSGLRRRPRARCRGAGALPSLAPDPAATGSAALLAYALDRLDARGPPAPRPSILLGQDRAWAEQTHARLRGRGRVGPGGAGRITCRAAPRLWRRIRR